MSRFYLKTKIESSHRNVLFLNKNRMLFWIKTRWWIMSRNIIFVLKILALLVWIHKPTSVHIFTLTHLIYHKSSQILRFSPSPKRHGCRSSVCLSGNCTANNTFGGIPHFLTCFKKLASRCYAADLSKKAAIVLFSVLCFIACPVTIFIS
jgi:hypothetical protein